MSSIRGLIVVVSFSTPLWSVACGSDNRKFSDEGSGGEAGAGGGSAGSSGGGGSPDASAGSGGSSMAGAAGSGNSAGTSMLDGSPEAGAAGLDGASDADGAAGPPFTSGPAIANDSNGVLRVLASTVDTTYEMFVGTGGWSVWSTEPHSNLDATFETELWVTGLDVGGTLKLYPRGGPADAGSPDAGGPLSLGTWNFGGAIAKAVGTPPWVFAVNPTTGEVHLDTSWGSSWQSIGGNVTSAPDVVSVGGKTFVAARCRRLSDMVCGSRRRHMGGLGAASRCGRRVLRRDLPSAVPNMEDRIISFSWRAPTPMVISMHRNARIRRRPARARPGRISGALSRAIRIAQFGERAWTWWRSVRTERSGARRCQILHS